jgi:hypothetical protein
MGHTFGNHCGDRQPANEEDHHAQIYIPKCRPVEGSVEDGKQRFVQQQMYESLRRRPFLDILAQEHLIPSGLLQNGTKMKQNELCMLDGEKNT